MTLTAMTEGPKAPVAGLVGPVGPVSGRQAERLQAQLVAAEVKRKDREAEDERRRKDREAEDERQQKLLNARDERRQKRADARDERRGKRRDARAETVSDAGEWVSSHRNGLMLVPIVLVPALLSWSAMSDFGIALFAGPGRALPVLSETGMWYFEMRIAEARASGGKVLKLYIGMVFCAAVCASLNFLHGDLGPIPGSIKPGGLTGVAYAVIAVSGIIIHQLGAGFHRERAERNSDKKAPAAAGVAPRDEKTAPEDGATNSLVARHLTGPLGRQLLPVVAVSGPPVGRAGSGATKDGLDRATADLDRAVAARKRAERENAELRQQLADALRGDSTNDEKDRDNDPENPARRGDYKTVMRTYWETEIATGNIPNGADLNRAAGKESNSSLGRRYASEWRNELPSGFTRKTTGNQQEETTQEESTSTVLAGAA
ncbi:MAG TPA: hypothetical protein VF223_24435 [Trebonia sp.]